MHGGRKRPSRPLGGRAAGPPETRRRAGAPRPQRSLRPILGGLGMAIGGAVVGWLSALRAQPRSERQLPDVPWPEPLADHFSVEPDPEPADDRAPVRAPLGQRTERPQSPERPRSPQRPQRAERPERPEAPVAEPSVPLTASSRRRPTPTAERRRSRLPLILAATGVAVAAALVALVGVGSLIEPDGGDPRKQGGPAQRLLATVDASAAEASSLAKPRPTGLGPDDTIVATAKRSERGVRVYAKPGAKEPEQRVELRKGQKGGLVFAATKRRGSWLKAMLPIRPNGSTGWIREQDVTLAVTDWSIKMSLSDHVVSVRRGGKTFGEWSIGLGQQDTPTPTGEFYITELIQPKQPDTIYGAYVFVLSGYSEKLTRYAGGKGELGLHGTNDPSGLGNDVSHGCIRIRNSVITDLTNRLPLGTPIEIVK